MSSRSFLGKGDDKNKLAKHRSMLMPCFYFAELPLFVLTSVATYTLHFTSTFSPIPIKFSTEDYSIGFPYIPKPHRSISAIPMYVGTTLGPIAIIIVVESVLLGTMMFNRETGSHSIRSAGCIFPIAMRRIVRYVGIFLFGYMASTIICDVMQLFCPVLAPYIANVCDPVNSTTMSTSDCRSAEIDMNEVLRQFPSYFCTIASYSSAYSMIYLRKAMYDAGPAIKTLVTWSPLIFAYILGILEIAENVSQPCSVLAGWILGVLVAVYVNIGLYTSDEGKLSKACQKRIVSKKENPFDTALNADFMVKEETEDDDADRFTGNRVVEECTSFHFPAHSKISQTPERIKQSPKHLSPVHSAVGRNVIKELQNYIGEADSKLQECESPKPGHIRQMAKGSKPQDDQRFSTFCNQSSTESSPGHSQNSPHKDDDMNQYHPDLNGLQTHCIYPRKIISIKEEVESPGQDENIFDESLVLIGYHDSTDDSSQYSSKHYNEEF